MRTEKGGRQLRKVFGTPALFSTAYSSLASSTYHALDLTAGYSDTPPGAARRHGYQQEQE